MFAQLLQEPAATGRFPENATLPGVRKLGLSACLKTVAGWIVRSGARRALRELANDKRVLNDIGLTREQVLGEAGKPFWRR
jgi:uncharacterized protein YjiS (DUF1127 family)